MVHPEVVLDLIESFRRSKTMFAAVSLRIFDRLHESPSAAAALAEEIGADAGALERLLDACVGLNLLHLENGLYSNSGTAATYLRRASPQTLAGYILYSDRVLYPMWGNLESAVKEGSHRWKQTFDLEGPIFQSFFRTEEFMRTFMQGMHGFGLLGSPAIVRIFNLAGFQTICDLGGGTGHLAAAACERYGQMRGVVFDLASVLPMARETIAASPAAERMSTMAGDFFSDPLPPADLYALSRILHDWNDERCALLLRRIHEALPSGGAVLIAEALIEDDRSGPLHAHMQSLNMLICTEGRERTEAEYRTMLESVGFHRVESRRTGAPLDATLAYKP